MSVRLRFALLYAGAFLVSGSWSSRSRSLT